MENWYKIENVDLKCFACGRENNCGLQMSFESNGKIVRSENIIARHHRGWATLAHGGIIATILDETMSWAAIHFFRKFILTRSIEIEFLKPVYIEKKVLSNGWIHEQLGSRKAVMKSEILNDKNEACARATASFALFDPDSFKNLKIVPEDLLNEMEGMFK